MAARRAGETALVTAAHLTTAGIGFHFFDYGDGSGWAPGCIGKHAEEACVQADMNHFVGLVTRLTCEFGVGRTEHFRERASRTTSSLV
ncbi:hypothetical protein SAMN05216188_105122 [Lentzea xinjiangensis]|uniref:Uncharacterized protein n=2 Tax=Lentzea xinjiangensis TaxID=402600 RepID=A0A1H9IWZ7_9PSEU|nr:hypothetical protein SAMN05216188_105122 [Lentzea xinjiangensis]